MGAGRLSSRGNTARSRLRRNLSPHWPHAGGGQPGEGVGAEAAGEGRSAGSWRGGRRREAPRGRRAAPARPGSRAHTGGAAGGPPPGCLRGGAAQLRPAGGGSPVPDLGQRRSARPLRLRPAGCWGRAQCTARPPCPLRPSAQGPSGPGAPGSGQSPESSGWGGGGAVAAPDSRLGDLRKEGGRAAVGVGRGGNILSAPSAPQTAPRASRPDGARSQERRVRAWGGGGARARRRGGGALRSHNRPTACASPRGWEPRGSGEGGGPARAVPPLAPFPALPSPSPPPSLSPGRPETAAASAGSRVSPQ